MGLGAVFCRRLAVVPLKIPCKAAVGGKGELHRRLGHSDIGGQQHITGGPQLLPQDVLLQSHACLAVEEGGEVVGGQSAVPGQFGHGDFEVQMLGDIVPAGHHRRNLGQPALPHPGSKVHPSPVEQLIHRPGVVHPVDHAEVGVGETVRDLLVQAALNGKAGIEGYRHNEGTAPLVQLTLGHHAHGGTAPIAVAAVELSQSFRLSLLYAEKLQRLLLVALVELQILPPL